MPEAGRDRHRANLPFARCPTCGDSGFIQRVRYRQVLFICEGCGATWRYLLGYLVPISDG